MIHHILKNIPRKRLILDVGCGYFTHANLLRSYAKSIICVDISNYDRDEALKNNFLLASAESLLFKDESFDFLYSLSVFQFIMNDTRAIDEFHRVLKPGCRLLRDLEIRFGVNRYPQFNVHGHHYYSRGSIRQMTRGRFKLIDVSGYGYNLFPRLRTFLVAVLRSNGVIRRVWRNLPKTRKEPLTETPIPVKIDNGKHAKPDKLGGLSGLFRGKFEFVDDLSYHYIVVLEKGEK